MITIIFETGEELDLPLVTFIKSNLKELELHRAIFDGLNLSEADFTGSNLRNASFNHSMLNGAVMNGAALMNASFIEAKMRCVYLVDVVAAYADFSGADLSMANLKNADIGGASFVNSNLRDVDIDVKRIDGAVFSGAIYNDGTIWPKGFAPESFGAVRASD
jgi:uncharacterized protein YjbI with pentapeptide repeats